MSFNIRSNNATLWTVEDRMEAQVMACDPSGCFRSSIDKHILLRLQFVPEIPPIRSGHVDCLTCVPGPGMAPLLTEPPDCCRDEGVTVTGPEHILMAVARLRQRGNGWAHPRWATSAPRPGELLTLRITGGLQAKTSQTSPPPSPRNPRGLGTSTPP